MNPPEPTEYPPTTPEPNPATTRYISHQPTSAEVSEQPLTPPEPTPFECPQIMCPTNGPCPEGWEHWWGLDDADGCGFCGECKKLDCDFKLEECGRQPRCDTELNIITPRDSTSLFINFEFS